MSAINHRNFYGSAGGSVGIIRFFVGGDGGCTNAIGINNAIVVLSHVFIRAAERNVTITGCIVGIQLHGLCGTHYHGEWLGRYKADALIQSGRGINHSYLNGVCGGVVVIVGCFGGGDGGGAIVDGGDNIIIELSHALVGVGESDFACSWGIGGIKHNIGAGTHHNFHNTVYHISVSTGHKYNTLIFRFRGLVYGELVGCFRG